MTQHFFEEAKNVDANDEETSTNSESEYNNNIESCDNNMKEQDSTFNENDNNQTEYKGILNENENEKELQAQDDLEYTDAETEVHEDANNEEKNLINVINA